ncbi:serine hydrolase domain-containing protein [Geodermatophilus sp. SYSU D00965]
MDLKRERKELGVPGLSAAVVRSGQVLCTPVAGWADTVRKRRVTTETVFTWASVSKTVTATALLQLYEQGRFDLDDDVGAHLDFEVRIPSCPESPVTFRQLLCHTSGIRDSKLYGRSYVEGDSPVPLGTFLRSYLSQGGEYFDPKKNFRSRCPGTVVEYTNIGAGLIGHLVAVLSGAPFEEYVARHVFGPLGMRNTSFRLADLDRSMIALPGGKGPLQGFPTFPDGTLRSSPSNLAKFLIAVMQGGSYGGSRILEPTTVALMLRSQTPLDPCQGLIWYAERLGKRTLWGHVGDDPGVSATMFFDPVTETGVLLAANGEWRDEAWPTVRRLLRWAREHQPPGRLDERGLMPPSR